MFHKAARHEAGLDEAIDALFLELKQHPATSDEHKLLMRDLDLLFKMKASEKPDRVGKDTIALIAGNLAGIVMILGFEKANVVTSKALSFVMKAR